MAKSNRKRVWIVGKVDRAGGWEFQGVFSDDQKQKAIAACKDDRYFLAPATLNVKISGRRQKWPGAYFPMVKAKTKGKV